MINLNEAKVTLIQFFNTSRKVQVTEDGDWEEVRAYSANIILNDKVVVQVSGNDEEAHKVYIPESFECYYNDEDTQNWASENLDIDEVEEFLEAQGFENNFNWLNENSQEKY